MFDLLLKGIFAQQELTTEQEQIDYLRGLRKAGRELWSSYQTQNVQIDYSRTDIQHAYLLRYFPFYTQLVPRVLDEHEVSLLPKESLQATFFGCGPGAELIGLLMHLREHVPVTDEVRAKFVDVALKAWENSIRLNLDYVVPTLWDKQKCRAEGLVADLSVPQLSHTVGAASCHLAVFQNCFNEIARNQHGKLVENIKELCQKMPSGAVTLIVDRSKYGITNQSMTNLTSWAQQCDEVDLVGDCSLGERQLSCRELNDKIPNIILDNLYYRGGGIPLTKKTTGLILTSNITFVSLALQRR